MAKFVRAKTPDGDEVNVHPRAIKAQNLTRLDKPAYDKYGRQIPPKKNIHKGGTSAKAASDKKES